MAHTQYRVSGKRVPSVTTILGKFKDPGPLMWWANDCAMNPLEEVVGILEEELPPSSMNAGSRKGINTNGTSRLRKWLHTKPIDRGNFRNEAGRAAAAGTLAHNLVEQWLHASKVEKGNLERVKPLTLSRQKKVTKDLAEKALSSFHAFLKWQKSFKFKVIATEKSLVHHALRYGGTIDLIATVQKELCVVDWKTSKAIYSDYLLQIAAYGALWNVNNGPDQQIQGYHLLRFDKATADFTHKHWEELDDAWEQFKLFRQCYDLDKRVQERAK